MQDERFPDGRYDFKTTEPRLQSRWAADRIYEFDPAAPGRPFAVDTPPPTVSGRIHVGHVYSYTHADVVSRYQRMRGRSVFYPFGFDDNGLPTERFTENSKGIRARDVGRHAFIEACLELSATVEDQFERFWKRLGLSVDWRLRYSTIDPRSRRVSQEAFIDLHAKGYAYRQVAPTLWCPECVTAIAQADVDDKPNVSTQFSTIRFTLDDGRTLPIATTRPELLPACVAIFVHPADARYQSAIGRLATTPLFDRPVPVLADEGADREKGTGAVMCCTFGDAADVAWWRTHNLPLQIILTPDGRLNELAGAYAGRRIRAARTQILADLDAAGLVLDKKQIEHTVGVHERCGTPVEYLVASQWFVNLLEHKQEFLNAGERIRWHPEHMRARYVSWIEGLSWDWNISRQRYYGVPFPVWYCRSCAEPVLASREQLPVDPLEASAIGACPHCGATDFEPDSDVMDTWATSSMTPQICGTLLEPLGVSPAEFDARYRPMTLRPNAHDIIRTWDFYTIVRSLYRTGDIPWTDVLISGHALDPQGKKISKSKLTGAEDPTGMLEQFSADAIRYWATSVRTGGDTVLSEEVFRNGSRLVTKLWNAAKLVVPHLERFSPLAEPPALNATDRWLLSRLHATIERATAAMEQYELATAKAEVERFFWSDLCDNYLELVKLRLYGDADGGRGTGPAEQEGARYTLFHALLSVLKLLAPFMPHIADEIYQIGFAATDGARSIHVASWPTGNVAWSDPSAEQIGQVILEIAETVRRWKAERHVSLSAPLDRMQIACPDAMVAPLEGARVDLRSVTRARAIELLASSEGTAVRITIEAGGGA